MLYNTESVLLRGWISLSYKSYRNEAPVCIDWATLSIPEDDFTICYYVYSVIL